MIINERTNDHVIHNAAALKSCQNAVCAPPPPPRRIINCVSENIPESIYPIITARRGGPGERRLEGILFVNTHNAVGLNNNNKKSQPDVQRDPSRRRRFPTLESPSGSPRCARARRCLLSYYYYCLRLRLRSND